MIGQRLKAAIAGFFGSSIDLANLQRQNEILLAHEHEMRERNRHFDAALSNMAQGLCMFDENLRLVACNQNYRDLFSLPAHVAREGASLKDMIAYSCSVGRHPGTTAEDVFNERRAVFAKGAPATLLTIVDGKTTIQTVYRPMAGGGWVATYEDITERVRAEAALAEQNNRFDAALNNMPHGLAMFDGHRRLIVCNRQFAEMYRFPEHMKQPGTALDEIVAHRIATNQGPLDIENFHRDLDKRTTSAEASNYKLPLRDGRTILINVEPMLNGGWVTTHQDITARESAEAALAEQHRRFDIALNNMYHGLCMFDEDKRLIVCNRRYADMYRLPEHLQRPGTTLDEIFGYRVDTRQGPLDLDGYRRDQLKRLDEGKSISYKLQLTDGRVLQVDSEHMAGGGWVATHQDITARERAEAALAEQHRRFDSALNNMYHGLCMFDENRRMIVCNRRYADMYRLPEHLQRPGTMLDEVVKHRIDTGQGPADLEGYKREQLARLSGLYEGRSSSYKMQLQDGRILQIDSEHMEGGGWIATHQDITEAMRAEAQIKHLARHDALTNLPNRVVFRSNLEDALKRVPRGGAVAVLCLDLDQFKPVNDTLGHPVGDALLQEVAERLRGCIRETDTASRVGGDEFAIVLTTDVDPIGVTAFASRVIDTLSAPYTVAGNKVVIGASIGIALAPDDGSTPDELLKNADLALYRAKSDGRGVYRFFEPGMDAKVQARRAMELDLRNALENDEFELFYQPLVNLVDRRIVAFEALLRWRHPERGLVLPGEFIALAEETGLIVPLGAWVLTEACAQAVRWPEHIKVSVNLSPVQFKSNTLALNVIAALNASGLDPKRLELEVTETAMLHDTEGTLAILTRLRELGVSVSMDDFGTGYSSLSYLRKFPFDKIKIDRSFVHGLSGEEESAAIVRAVTGLGRSLGMTTTAEGVESADQLEMLRKEGCTEVQGFLFSAPVPSEQIGSLLEQLDRSLRAA
jgi:diguanylate cyclase (GGDEF)-like protein